MMKLLYDYQIFELQKYGGISRYFVELAKHYNADEDMNVYISAKISKNEYLVNSYIKDNLVLHSKYIIRKRHYIESKVNRFYNRYKLTMKLVDIFHPTYYDPYFLKYIGKTPFVLTVHDMIHEQFSEMFSPNDETSRNKKLLAERASKIIAISESTKQDIVNILGIDESKIVVVYHGNSLVLISDANIDIVLPDRYILYVGNRSIYKNFNKFIKSTSSLLCDDVDLHLVCAGGGTFSKEEKQLFSEFDIDQKLHQFSVDDNALATLYAKAIIFVFPSLYEGFGIPILEAFQCNCPLVCSNTSSFYEVAGDAAEYFDPEDEVSILTIVKKVLYDDELQKKLVQAGQKRLIFFSCKNTADETKKVYQSVLNV